MADKQLNMILKFQADTNQAKKEIVDLANTLRTVASMQVVDNNTIDLNALQQGRQAASELLRHLQKAVNIDTGKLNLATFSSSLKTSGKTLKDYKNELEACGPAGQEAFQKVAISIATAENPVRRLNKTMQGFLTTLKNTAKWQLSSTMVHGFIGALQSAYGYAQNLNKSLTNIQIVTGQSAEQMEQFAIRANKAAKALSASTLAYTDAALIYYQQGLDDSAVEERTNTTIKMMNVTGQSAEEVSSYMTAIWNNFDNGTNSLEYYADAITALGAATASSSEEIADGLQKFAAIADTVGLSYEYATSALATVVAETRQSADVIGTSFKTIFARMQGLSLGETLDDGVDLNKYSIALQKIGVNVLDANGNLRQMDDILDDLGARWESLTEAQRVAIAETVGGMRQYANFMALMDNWSEVQKNITIAANSEGTLQEQADIYAQSWEGAKKRLQASLQGIYHDIIDDKTFISMTDNISKVVDGVNGLIKGLGGVRGILLTVANIFAIHYAKEMPRFLERIKENLFIITGYANKVGAEMQAQARETIHIDKESIEQDYDDPNGGSAQETARLEILEQISQRQQELNENQAIYSQDEINYAEEEIEKLKDKGKEIEELGRKYDEAKAQAQKQYEAAEMLAKEGASQPNKTDIENVTKWGKEFGALKASRAPLKQISDSLEKTNSSMKVGQKQLTLYGSRLLAISKSADKFKNNKYPEALEGLNNNYKTGKITAEEYKEGLINLNNQMSNAAKNTTQLENNLRSTIRASGENAESMENLSQACQDVGSTGLLARQGLEGVRGTAEALPAPIIQTSTALMQITGAFMSFTAIVNGVQRLKDVFADEDASAIEKIGAVIGVLTSIVTSYIAIQKMATAVMEADTKSEKTSLIVKKVRNIIEGIRAKLIKNSAKASLKKAGATVTEGVAEKDATASTIAHGNANIFLHGTLLPVLVITLALVAAFGILYGAVALISQAIKSLSDDYNADANAAKEAKEAASQMAEQATAAREEVDKLREAFEKYDTAVEKLKQCKKGTQEWRDALKEVNTVVANLIREFPNLASSLEISRDQSGQIVIENAEEVMQEAEQRASNLEMVSIAMNARASDKQSIADKTALQRQGAYYYTSQVLHKISNPTAHEPIDNYSKVLAADQEYRNILEDAGQYADKTDDELKHLQQKLGMTDEYFESFKKNLKELGESTNQAAREIDNAAKIIANQVLGDKFANLDENPEIAGKVSEAIEILTAEAQQKKAKEIEDDIIAEDKKNNKKGNDTTPTSEDIWARYLKASGKTEQEWQADANQIRHNADHRTYAYREDSELKEVSIKTMAAVIAAYESLGDMEESAKGFAEIFSNMNSEAKLFAANIINSKDENDEYNTDLAVGGLNAQKIQDLTNIKVTTEDGINQMAQMLGMSRDQFDELVKNIGFESSEKLANSIRESAANARKEIEAVFTSQPSNVMQQIYNDIAQNSDSIFNTISTDALKNYGDMLSKILQAGGENVVMAFNHDLEKLLTANANSADKIMEIAQNIDWTSASGLDEFNKQLEAAGIEIDKNSAEWQAFVSSLERIPIKLQPTDVAKIRKTFLELSELASKIKIGSIISDDEYEKLIAANGALKSMFVQTANGYAYIGSQDLSTTVKENYQNDIRKDLNNSLIAQKGLKEISDYKYAENSNEVYGKKNADGRVTVDYEKLANAVKEGSAPEQATGLFLENLANDSEADAIAAVAGTSAARLSELAAIDIDSLTEEQKKAYYDEVGNVYQAIADNESQLGQYQESVTQDLIQLGSSYDSYAEGLAAIRSYTGEEFVSDEQIQEAIVGMTNAAVMGVQSLDELDTILNEIAQAEQNVDYNTIAAALMNLASQYENCTAEVEKYQTAMRSGNTEALKVAEDQLRASILLGEAAEKYGLNANVLESQARSIQALNNDMELNAETAARMAIANQRMNKGINTLSDSLEDWKETLKTAKKGDVDWAKTIGEVEAAVKDLIGATDDFELPDDFLDAPENMKLLEKAADGDLYAINQLGNELTAVSIKAMEFDITMADAFKKLTGNELTAENFENIKNSVLDGLTAIHDNLKALTDGTMTLDEALGGSAESWIKSLNDMALATGMSVEEMNATLNQAGVQAHVDVINVPQKMQVPSYEEVSEEIGEKTFTYTTQEPDGKGGYETVTHEETHPVIRRFSIPGPSMEVDGFQQVAQISTTDNPLTPEINESKVSFTGVGGGKTGGGVGRSNTTSGKKDKSKSSSKKEKKDKKSAEKETERYHEITALIEDYTRELDKAGKAKDRAFGPKKLKAMQAEIAAQAQLNAATEEHIREIREWLEIDKARIAAQGATFDEYGNISNYTDLMQQHIDAYNAAVAAYNASGQSDSDKEAMEAADKAYQDFMDQLSQYEETNNLLQEKLDELIEAQQAKYDKEFEMLQYTIEFKIEADDSILSYLDYMKNKIENFNDGVHDAVEMLATLNNEASTLMNKSSIYNHAIDDTLSHYLSNKGMEESDIQALIDRFKSNNMSESDMSMLEDMTEAEYQYLLELKDNLLEINNSLIENMSAVVETIRNSFSKIAEDLDKATRPIERAASALENYVAIIDIIGRDALNVTDAIATELDNAAIAVAHSATIAAKAKVDTLQNERDEVQRLYDEAMAQGLTEMAYKWKIVLEEMDEEIAAATDDFNSKWQEELTKAREAFENTVERIKQSMLDAFAGSIGSWSALKDSLEYAKTAADRFVPQYKEIYELSKLNRDIMKSIDNTSNIKNKQALRDLQKEINELEQHSGEISQYDLDNARRRYELELARLQLEEARDAKSTVRLSKDSEGNWSYVYTANQDEVEKAEQNYEDKLYAMQQANSEYINSLSDQILELEEQYAEKLAEIRLDNTMSEEERNAAIERLNAYFAEQMEYLTNEGQKAVDNNARLFEEEWTAYHNWTDAFGNDVQTRIDNQHDFMTQFGDTILGTYTGYGNFDELNAAMVQIAEEASVKMEEAYGALQAQVATAMEAAGIDVAHFGEVVHDTVNDQIVPSAQAAEDAVVEMGEAAVDEFNNLADGVSAWQIKYTTEMQKIIQKNEQLAASVNNLAAVYANLIAQMYAVANAPVPKFSNSAADYYANTGASGQSASGGDLNSDDPGDNEYADSAHWKSDHHYHWRVRTYKSGRTEKIDKGRHKWYLCDPIVIDSHHHSPTTFESAYCAVCGKKISINPWHQYASVDGQEVIIPGYDTGGYTGNWNSSQGKLAMLHEKELVLNKEDTKNILGTVELVRKLSQKIDLNAQTARYAFNYHPIINNPKLTDRELQVNQTVSITAEFPNAQNRTEIEEAFTTLINQASQFANQKN